MSAVNDELRLRATRSRKVIEQLEHNEGFNLMLEDFSKSLEHVDNTWHLVPSNEYNKLMDLKIQKYAALAIVKVIDNYKHDLRAAEKQLYELEHPDEVQGGYYDNE